MLNLIHFISIRQLREKPLRSLLTTLGVAFGIALYVAIAIINGSIKHSFRDHMEAVAGKAKLSVTAGISGFSESKIEDIKKTPGVAYAVPMIEAQAFFKSNAKDEESQNLNILGVDMLQESAVRSYKTTDQEIIDDPLIFLNQPDSIVVTKAFAEKFGLKTDSKFVVSTGSGKKTFTVRGLLEPEGTARAFGGSLAIMDIDGARANFSKVGLVDRVDIVPEDAQDIEELRTRLKNVVGTGVDVERPQSASENMERMIQSYQRLLTFFSTLALLVGLFLVYNSVSISVFERRREIGTLRALGSERRSILVLVISESVLVGLLGSLIGCILGSLLSTQLIHQITTAMAAQYAMRVNVAELVYPPSLFLNTVLIGMITAGISAFLPAFRASRIHPLETMKSRSSTEFHFEKTHLWGPLFGLGCLLLTVISTFGGWSRIWMPAEQVTQGFSVLGTALFGPLVVFVLIRGLKMFLPEIRFPMLRLAFDNLLKSQKRTASNIMALMVGLFLVMMIATTRSSFQKTLFDWLDEALIADILVSGRGHVIMGQTQPIDEKIADEVYKIKGVKPLPAGAQGTSVRIVQIESDKTRYTIKAFDRPSEKDEMRYFVSAEKTDRTELARKLFFSKEPAVLISENYFVKNPDLKVGDMLQLTTPSGVKEFRFLGRVVDYASAQGVFYMKRDFYKEYWKDPLVTSIAVKIEPGYRLEDVRSRIDASLGEKSFDLLATSNAEMKKYMREAMDQSFAYTRAIEGAALLVALLGLLNTLLINVLERTREIGVLRALGTTKKQVFRMIMLESVVQGTLGAVVAAMVGSLISKIWIENSLAHSLGWIITFYLPISSIVVTMGAGMFVAMIAGVYPSKRASGLPISEALDYE